MESENVISATNLTKRYNDLVAVDGISFSIRQKECFGFLGPNGAGKTSTMKMISCISPVTEGELWVDGKDVHNNQRAIKRVLGVVSQADSLDPDLSVIQNLLSFGRFFNLPRDTANHRAWESLELFQLKDRAHDKPDELSGGLRRRLLIARALIHVPKILILDEPSTGLDPQARLFMWENLSFLKSQGVTILLTTHYMEEASYLCDRLVVMDNGRILVEGTPAELIRTYAGEQVLEIRVDMAGKAELLDTLKNQMLEFDDAGDSVFIFSNNGSPVPEKIDLDGYRVIRRPGNLEDVFLRITGRGLRGE